MNLWEDVDFSTRRLRAGSGWLVQDWRAASSNYVFVPDAERAWEIKPKPPVPTLVENYLEVEPGTWVSLPGWSKHSAALHYYDKLGGYSKAYSLRFTRNSKFPAKGNYKGFRMWSDGFGGGHYPCWWIGHVSIEKGQMMLYNELLDPVDGKTRFYFSAFPVGDGKDHDILLEWTMPSGYAKADGKIKITVDGKVYLDVGTWQCNGMGNGVDYRAIPNYVCLQDNFSNVDLATWPDGHYVKVKDIVAVGF